MNMKNAKIILFGLVALIILFTCSLAGNEDRKNEIEELRIYCENVTEGVWPDYEAKYKKYCGGASPPKREDGQFHVRVF